jgi:hypothetical protein
VEPVESLQELRRAHGGQGGGRHRRRAHGSPADAVTASLKGRPAILVDSLVHGSVMSWVRRVVALRDQVGPSSPDSMCNVTICLSLHDGVSWLRRSTGMPPSELPFNPRHTPPRASEIPPVSHGINEHASDPCYADLRQLPSVGNGLRPQTLVDSMNLHWHSGCLIAGMADAGSRSGPKRPRKGTKELSRKESAMAQLQRVRGRQPPHHRWRCRGLPPRSAHRSCHLGSRGCVRACPVRCPLLRSDRNPKRGRGARRGPRRQYHA